MVFNCINFTLQSYINLRTYLLQGVGKNPVKTEVPPAQTQIEYVQRNLSCTYILCLNLYFLINAMNRVLFFKFFKNLAITIQFPKLALSS